MTQPDPAGPSDAPIAGRFWIEETLGRGGMGAVYRVRDARTGKHVALKRGEARDPRKIQKRQTLLEREYHTLAQLAHPCIIEVYDYGVDELGPYYTMELLDGADLDKSGKLPWQRACALLRDVASSLAMLHSRGLLHRDVSSRNVRMTADGRAKLLDFGAMTSMGLAKEIVGTPPFVAPETLQLQALDARADLFSLGALGYYLLTGRHAFNARRLSELRDVWRSAPTAPIRSVPELPHALNNLIMQLLNLDRSARPQSAAEVMERLCAIAGLPMEERAEVTRAYLSTPVLIGREKALLAVRRRMLSLVRGDGGALLIEGLAGSGRSRLLDACVLEGKLLGAAVLRADASDSISGDWGVARALGAQLFELVPEAALEAARLSRDVLSHVLDNLREDERPSGAVPERSLLLRELRDFVLSLSRGRRLFVVIDDIDRIDEPSAALLAALAHKTEKHSLMLAVSVARDESGATSASVRLLRSVALAVEVEQLEAEQTTALMRSVFGDAANLDLVAGRIHTLCHGNPRAAMELAQHLVDRGLARYQAGSWSLPSELAEGDLPSSLAASLAARLSTLSAEARELAAALCLADGDPLTLADYAALTEHKDSGLVFRALDELVASRILSADGDRYRFSQRGFLSVLNESIDERLRSAIHGRLADLLATRNSDLMRRAHHLLLGGREREGAELLTTLDLRAIRPPLPLSERALDASIRLGMPRSICHVLRTAVLAKAPLVMAIDTFRRQLPLVLAQLEHDSGLDLFRELHELPANDRLSQALARAQQRYEETPAHERVYSPIDAIRELASFLANCCAISMQLYDLDFMESLPSLEPLMPLSPALTVVAQIVEACKETLRGRSLPAKRALEQGLLRLSAPDRAGLDASYHHSIQLGLHYMLGLVDASMGIRTAEQHAQILEGDREHRVNAWRVRVSMHLNQGNSDEARKCQRRAELLQLQEGSEQRYIGTSIGVELLAYALIDDLVGLKQAIEAVTRLAEHYPGWRPVLIVGRAYYRWLQGDLAGALQTLLPVFELAQPTRHLFYPYAAAAHIGLLGGLGRVDEAIQQARTHLAVCDREQLCSLDRWVQQASALAFAQGGQFPRALQLLDEAIVETEGHEMIGLSLGMLYEARARIAIWMDDTINYERYAGLCAGEYKKGKNPTLSAKFGRLQEEARQKHVTPEVEQAKPGVLLVSSQAETGFETIHSRMLECVDQSDRARCALTIVLQSMESFSGYLFGVGEGARLSPLAALPEARPDEGLNLWLEASLKLEIESLVSATATADGDEEQGHSELATRYTDPEGRVFEPIFLTAKGERDERIAAVLALHVQPGPRSIPPKELLGEIACQLVEHGDVTGVVI